MATGLKTVYVLRVRPDDDSQWGEPEYYSRRKDRDEAERLNRCLGGIRTHSYNEKKTSEEIDELCD